MKKSKQNLIILTALLLGIIAINKTVFLSQVEAKSYLIPSMTVKAQNGAFPAPELTVEDTVLNMVKEAGLNHYEAWAIINAESHWQADAVAVEPNGTYSLGLWMINSIHKDINNTDKMNYIKSTRWAIEKRLKDGNWNSWSVSNKLNL